MRVKHTLWKVSNGWLLVPEDKDGYLNVDSAGECAIFKTLKEFADYKPRRVRSRKPKAQPDAIRNLPS